MVEYGLSNPDSFNEGLKMKTYITFGSTHRHKVQGKVLDQNTVAVFEHKLAGQGRSWAFQLFGPKFAFEYDEEHWNHDNMDRYFLGGYVEIDGSLILKPCPFCGSEEVVVVHMGSEHLKDLYEATCRNCDASSPLHNTLKEATATWNHRAGDDNDT